MCVPSNRICLVHRKFKWWLQSVISQIPYWNSIWTHRHTALYQYHLISIELGHPSDSLIYCVSLYDWIDISNKINCDVNRIRMNISTRRINTHQMQNGCSASRFISQLAHFIVPKCAQQQKVNYVFKARKSRKFCICMMRRQRDLR